MRDIATRMKRALGLAVIKLIDDAGPYQRVQLDLGPTGTDGQPLQLRDNTFVLQHFGFSSHPPRGSDAAIIALGGDANQVLVVATGNREFRIPMAEGGAVIHDSDGHFIKIIPGEGIRSVGNWVHEGDFEMTGAQTVHGDTLLDGNLTVAEDALVEGDLGVSGDTGIDGDLEVLGDITDRAGSNAVTLFTLRFRYNAHAHGGVDTGSGTSAVTNQPAT